MLIDPKAGVRFRWQLGGGGLSKTGAFVFNGIIAFTIPLTALFVRVVALTVESLMAFRWQAASACTRPG